MKKLYALFLFVATLGINTSFAGVNCTVDPFNTALFNPDPDHVPCAEVGIAYNETLHFYVPTSQDITLLGQTVTVFIDSVILNTVTGLPAGFNWSANPAGPLYMPDTHGCGLTVSTGPVSAAPGNYPISFDGVMYMHGSAFGFTIDTSFALDQIIQQKYGKTFSLDVIASGGLCHPSGIKDFSAELNSLLSVYPNPNNGIFEVRVDAARRVNGEVVIVDATGRKVFSQNLDVVGLYNTSVDLSNFPKGLYTLQLRTGEGFASKNISVE